MKIGKRVLSSLKPKIKDSIRYMSLLERYYSASHNADVYYNFCIIAEMEGSIPSSQYPIAVIHQLVKRHPSLSFVLNDVNQFPYLTKMEGVEDKVFRYLYFFL
jgi:hypothetical protein